MLNIIGVRFQRVGKIYHFDASTIADLQAGDYVVVETSRGRQLGEVVHFIEDPQRPPEGYWKPVQRKATPQDLVQRQMWKGREAEALVNCREKAKELSLASVKFFAAEYSYDGSRLSFLYSMDEGLKMDFTSLRRSLLRIYPHTSLDLHQIGPRDVAKLLGGIGACGLSNRCCSMFITDFSPVSIKMAKEQGISLTPTEITGMCGRLRCCLVYEYEQYVEARKHLPKRNKRVVTPKGEGRVLDALPLINSVIVELEDGTRQTFRRDEIEPWDELSALRRKAEQSCSTHPEGGCNCRKQAASEENELVEDEELGYSGEAVSLQLDKPATLLAPPTRQESPGERGRGGSSQQRQRPQQGGKPHSRPKQTGSESGPPPAQQQSSQRQKPPRNKQNPRRSGQKPAPPKNNPNPQGNS